MNFASWRKCDFQLHTPRDPNWNGKRPVGLGDETDNGPATQSDVDAARIAWANDFINICLKRDLRAVAITDHHEMVMIPYVQLAISQRLSEDAKFDLWLFPGMELTCRNGVQCLILFDADLSKAWRIEAQSKLGITIPSLNVNGRQGPKVTQLDFPYPEISKRLDVVPELQGRFIVLPNVSQGGQHTVLTEGSHADFKSMSYVGGYLDRGQNIETISGKNKRRLSGEEDIWGNRFVYPLPTSDGRSADFSKAGTNSCWIKLAAPTAEAIRQAFLGHRSRISIEPPLTPTLSVNFIEVSGSEILTDRQIDLSSELNSFIGGRGSGKSTLLEYVAFGLGRSCYDLPKDAFSGADRLKELISQTLIAKGATLSVGVTQDGAEFKVRRGGSNAYQPDITYPDGTTQKLSTKELRTLFPAVVYSQGELSELGKQAGKRTHISDLLQFVDQEYKREDERLNAEIDASRMRVRKAIQGLSSAWAIEAKISKFTASKASLEQRIGALQKTLPELSDADKATVSRYEKLSALEAKRQQAKAQVASVMEEVTQLWKTSRKPVDLSSELPEAGNFQKAFYKFNAEFSSGIEALGIELGKHRDAMVEGGADIDIALDEAKVARDLAMNKLTEHRSATAQISNLQVELQGVLKQIAELSVTASSADEWFEKLKSAVDGLKEAVAQKGGKTREWANKIETLSGNRIEAQLKADANWTAIHEAVEALTAKANIKEATRIQQTDEYLKKSGAWPSLDSLRTDALAALRWHILSQSESGKPPQMEALVEATGATSRAVERCVELMDVQRVEAIATAVPSDDISLLYCDGDRKISFEKASEGQRAAALLFMLLEQPGGPLLVDQPEGDLDNKIVSDLAEKLHDAKKNRQIIFASHNANIVVNGSSELVLGLDVSENAKRDVACGGAIDTKEVCDKITEIMEGGPQAFRDRKEKYGY
ncbi:AAA domain-containing protein, putative AbiEii toxin, Type IV TA system [Poseidonocella pacifica]|uniref:AAA domain-containing protein, putative AbiEii toxin, Type IV TA system n=2 Tax=Poseidonocella pacifica TaxID=871651 RepID=A0A1I0W878_9RHOB|nr:AAA domain-containing protein, putative AbiEii toxin, Type IV TA system [Poseidonocella pacifica]